ncbi:hypothetical protein V2G26_001114 [Clonostachys chloroleuca]
MELMAMRQQGPIPSQAKSDRFYQMLPRESFPPATNQPTTARGRNRNASYIVRPTVQSAEETGDRFAAVQVEFDARIPFTMALSHISAIGDGPGVRGRTSNCPASRESLAWLHQ